MSRDGPQADESGRPTCLIVLGMHRSGSSALVRVASLLGYALPATLLGGKATSNPMGHWESLTINRLNDDILATADLKWRSLEPIGDVWQVRDLQAGMRARALDTVAQEYGSAPFFVLKDPRISLLLPFWLSVLDEFGAQVRIVSLTRDPIECAASLEVRNGLSMPFNELLWLRYVLEGERASRAISRAHVSYNQLLSNWRLTAGKMRREGGVAFPVAEDAAAADIDAFLSPDERHHRADPGQSRASWVRIVAEIMARWADEGENAADHATLDGIRAAFDNSFDQLGDALQVGMEGALRATKSQALRSVSNRALKDAKLVQSAQLKQIEDLSGTLAADQALLKDARETAKAATLTNATLAAEILTRRRDLFRTQRDARRDLAGRERAFAAEQVRIGDLAAAQAATIERLEGELRLARDAADGQRGEIVERDARIDGLNAVIEAQDMRLMHQEAAAATARRQAEAAERRLARTALRANATRMLRQRLGARDREIEVNAAELARLAGALADATATGAALGQRMILLEDTHREAEHRLAAAAAAGDAAQARARIEGVRHAQSVARYQAAIHERDGALSARRSIWPYRPTAEVGTPVPGFDEDHALVTASDLFDPAWYLGRYPDVAAASVDPVHHYLGSGAREGRDPSPWFSSRGYLRLAPDVAAASLNPLLHYLRSGIFEGRKTPTPAEEQREHDRDEIASSPLFDAGWYRETYADLPASADAAADYRDRGASGDRDPGPLFSSEAYLVASADVRALGINPLLHYLRHGWDEGRPAPTRAEHQRVRDAEDIRADPWFDEAWYLATYPEVAHSGEDAAAHYLAAGAGSMFDPGPAFSSAAYLDASPDVRMAGGNPLLHYRRHGQSERRFVIDVTGRARMATIALIADSALFDAAWYLDRYPDVRQAGDDPAAHYVDRGWSEGRDPGPGFSTICYLDAMSHAGEQHGNPLLHYLMHGRHEGRPIVPAPAAEMNALVGAIAAHPLFNAGWYAKRNPGALPEKYAAARHYIAIGTARHRNPGPGFRVEWYESRYPDVQHHHIAAFIHFIRWGEAEGREPVPPCAATDDIRLPTPVRSADAALAGDRGTAGLPPPVIGGPDDIVVEAGPSPVLREAFRALHDHRREAPLAQDVLDIAGLAGGVLTDFWFVNDGTLRLRIDTPPIGAASCTAYAGPGTDPVPCGRRTIVRGVPCLIDATLPDGLYPLFLLLHDAQGHLLDELLIPFPSLARGGLHEAEAVAALMSAPADAPDSLAAVSDRMLRRWLAHRGERAAIGALRIVANHANGTERVFEEATRNWLSAIMGLDVTVEHGQDALTRNGAGTTDRAAAPPRRTAADILVIGADCVPTIAALIATADDMATGTEAGLLLADPAGGRSVRHLATSGQGGAAGIGGFVNPALLCEGTAPPQGLVAPLAIAIRRSDVAAASLMFRTPADRAAAPGHDALSDVTVLLDGERPVERVMTALCGQAGGEQLEFVIVGPHDPVCAAAFSADRVWSVAAGDPVTVATRWVLVASADVVLPDADTVATLIRIADAEDIASAGCLEVRQAGKTVTASIGGWIGIADPHDRIRPGHLPFEAVADAAETVMINNPAFVLIPAGLWREFFLDRMPWSPDAWMRFTTATTDRGLRHVTTDHVSVALSDASPPAIRPLPLAPRLKDLVP